MACVAAVTTRSHASRMVMKYRTMSGCVTVTGPPASICALNLGTTEPFEASTFPNRTEISRIGCWPATARRAEFIIESLAVHFRQTLGGAQHRYRLDRLVGRNHHHGGRAGRRRRVGNVDRPENIGLDAFIPVLLKHRHVLERSGMKHDVRLELRQRGS